jgi:methionine aminopeptidase type I
MIRLKTSEEIERIRQSCRLLVETYEAIIPLAQPGVTTAELDKAAYDYIVKRGGKPAFLNYHGYPATLCTSVNETIIHGIPSKRKLKPGDILSLDLGIDLGGYFSDAALTLPIGTITPEARRLLAVTRQALYDGIEQAKAGKQDTGYIESGFQPCELERIRRRQGILRTRRRFRRSRGSSDSELRGWRTEHTHQAWNGPGYRAHDQYG